MTPAVQRPWGDTVDSSYLESLLGYNARRAFLVAGAKFSERMARFELKPADFSVLSLVLHNPGITSRQLCATLAIQPPNLVGLVGALERRGLVERLPHPRDGRGVGLHLTPAGEKLVGDAERTVAELEAEAASALSAAELRTLLKLLQKVYR